MESARLREIDCGAFSENLAWRASKSSGIARDSRTGGSPTIKDPSSTAATHAHANSRRSARFHTEKRIASACSTIGTDGKVYSAHDTEGGGTVIASAAIHCSSAHTTLLRSGLHSPLQPDHCTRANTSRRCAPRSIHSYSVPKGIERTELLARELARFPRLRVDRFKPRPARVDHRFRLHPALLATIQAAATAQAVVMAEVGDTEMGTREDL